MSAWLVVGLGNPGPRYAATRHNLGAVVVCELARRYAGGSGARPATEPPVTTTSTEYFRAHRTRALVAQVRLGTQPGGAPGPAAVLAVPTAYMNESGGPVKALLRFYGLAPDRLVVVHDEMDIPSGAIRLKQGGGEGGHNGLRSVTAALGTRDYLRVRVGIGRPPGRMDPRDFLLHDFSRSERERLPLVVSDAADATVALVTLGLVAAQQVYHPAKPEKGG
ncbi:MAG: aminoacyl-tRNA hydrolase [Dermatophilaceae bacterium]